MLVLYTVQIKPLAVSVAILCWHKLLIIYSELFCTLLIIMTNVNRFCKVVNSYVELGFNLDSFS